MAQILTATPITQFLEPGKECYEIDWTIPRWLEVRKSESLVNSQEAVFETGSTPSAWFRTKWLVGLKVVTEQFTTRRKARVYWKLLGIKRPNYSTKVEATLQTQLASRNGQLKFTDEKSLEVKLLDTVENFRVGLHFNPDSYSTDGDVVNLTGSIRFTLKLVLKTPTMSTSEHECNKMKQFSKKSVERLRQNQVALLNDHSETADVKFLTSDKIEIPAHKAILKAQCPVFEAMLNCDLSENATGIIRMTDISAKTMKLILHYFYTGELLPSWRDPDTIVEFTYAAGKYQMTEVLELLDEMLGRNFGGEGSHLDVQLINLAGKLKLEKAEIRLLQRIVAKVIKVGTGGELFELFGYEEAEIAEVAEALASETVGESKILGMIDDLYDGSISTELIFEMGMIVLTFVEKKGLKKLEKNLLKCFAENAELLENAEELFDLFGRGKQMRK